MTWMGPSMSGLGGSVVTRPVHVPARLFKAPNEICTSDVAGIAFCPGEVFYAKVRRHGDSTPIQSTNGSDFTAGSAQLGTTPHGSAILDTVF